jgi:predicted RNA-binding protein YlxR (DUF448 family)
MQKKPTRMCIACRAKEPQNDLIRLQLQEKQIVPYSGAGRSFYLCRSCAINTKKMYGIAKRLGIEHEDLLTILKEFVIYGEN